MVPAKNGTIPGAPEGEHNSHAGTLFEPVVGPGADGLLDPDCPDSGDAEIANGAEAAPAPAPAAVPAGELLDPAAAFGGVVVPGNATAPYGFARLAPAVPEICAKAEPLSTTESNTTT